MCLTAWVLYVMSESYAIIPLLQISLFSYLLRCLNRGSQFSARSTSPEALSFSRIP